jgi:hypothetical protein
MQVHVRRRVGGLRSLPKQRRDVRGRVFAKPHEKLQVEAFSERLHHDLRVLHRKAESNPLAPLGLGVKFGDVGHRRDRCALEDRGKCRVKSRCQQTRVVLAERAPQRAERRLHGLLSLALRRQPRAFFHQCRERLHGRAARRARSVPNAARAASGRSARRGTRTSCAFGWG